ncbi:MAG: cobalamin-binding protein [Candidatus Omnitrophica bacterium]|nr:cobalamin-binding protein [Candidatus Omnitrophota bacterium]MBU4473300.1 cobalamin-binding protein [Candidatus Omnitrophota bacterium]MCG2706595.1 cobalamin-binding protein [Candidatus Omnitrophota bacterium]
MKKIFLIINLILIFFLGQSAKGALPENHEPRYISLAPSTTEILFSLGLDKEIIGVSSFCNYPLKAQEKEKIGSFSQPNIEKILSLKPDIIFCTGLEQTPAVGKLRQLDLKVYVSNPSNMEELFTSIKEMAALTDKEKEAEVLVYTMKLKIEKIYSKVKLIPQQNRPTVFVEYWNKPLMTAGRDSFIDDLITLAGGVNIAYDTPRPYSYFSPEVVIRRNPTCIILAYMVNEKAAQAIRERLGWRNISAIKHNRVYTDINPDLLLRPGPRVVEGLAEMYKRLYLKNE